MHRFRRYFPTFPDDDGAPHLLPDAPLRVDSPGPYVAAGVFGAFVIGLTVALTDVPTAPLVGIGILFAALAVTTRRLRELAKEPRVGLARRARSLCRALDERWGLEFYGLAAVTAFLWLEAGSLVRLEIGDTLGNAGLALLWWYPAWMHVGDPLGTPTFVMLLAAAWTFWFVLGVHPEEEPFLH